MDRAISMKEYNCTAMTRILDVRPTRKWALIQNADYTGGSNTVAYIFFGGEAAVAGTVSVVLYPYDAQVTCPDRIMIDESHPWDGEVFGLTGAKVRVTECWE